MVWFFTLLACGPGTKADTTFHYGGTATLSIAPVSTEGLAADASVDGAPALENLADCKSYMQRREPRASDAEITGAAEVCLVAAITGNSCYDEAELEVVLSLDGSALLFIENAAGYTVETASLTADIVVADSTFAPSGFVRGTVTLDSPCYGSGPLEHTVEAEWNFSDTETLVEGRGGEIEPWLGDV